MLLAMAQNIFDFGGTITSAQSAPTTDKSAVTLHALASTKTAFVLPANGTVALEVRFRGVMTDGHSNVLNLYAMRGGPGVTKKSDHYTLIATLTLTTGTQIYSTGNLFVDTIVVTNEKWTDAIKVVNDAANGIAHLSWNTHGYSNFLMIATTLNSTSVIVEASQE